MREAMHSAFLYHAIKAGMDMAIVNPSMLQVYDEIEPELLKCVEDVIFKNEPLYVETLRHYPEGVNEWMAKLDYSQNAFEKTSEQITYNI